MPDQGLAAELINACEVSLGDGTDNYIQLQDLVIQLGHPETREETCDGAHYFYRKGDNFIEATLLATSAEISTFVGFTELDANAAPTSKNWPIAFTDVSGTVKTATLTGTMAPLLRFEKPIVGAVKMRIRIRVTEAVTTADIT